MSYNFWCWKPKLPGVLAMLSLLSGYGYTRDAEALVLEGLRGTDDAAGVWFAYDLSCRVILRIDMAYDSEDTDIVHLSINAPADFTDRLQLIDAIQSTLGPIELAGS